MNNLHNSPTTVACILLSYLLCLVTIHSPIGLLSEVTDVHLTQVNSTTVQLSYSSPPTLMGVPILNYSIELFSSSNNLTSEIYWTTEETILVTLNNPCINYLLQISAWNNVGKGNITTLPLILYQG